MRRNFTVIVWAILIAAMMSSCDDPKVAFNEDTLDIPYLFSEGYQDTIKYPYDLATPASDWLSMVKDETKVCKLSIPGTHDSMNGILPASDQERVEHHRHQPALHVRGADDERHPLLRPAPGGVD